MIKKLLTIIGVLSFILFAQTTGAFTTVPSDYSNGATGRLAVHITPTQTTGITITADTFRTPAGTGPVTFPTGNMILKLTQQIGNRLQVEYISADSATQSSATVTLVNVKRYIDPYDGSDFTSQGDGLDFYQGALVEQIFPTQFAENAMMRTNQMRMVNSGAILCTNGNTNGCIAVGQYTTAQITAMTKTGSMIFFDSDTSQMKFYDNSNVLTVATQTGSAANSGFGNRGEVEFATPEEIEVSTASGSSNAGLVPAVKDIITTSSEGTNTGRLVSLSGSGLFDRSVIGRNEDLAASGNYLRVNGQKQIVFTASVSGGGSGANLATSTGDVVAAPTNNAATVFTDFPVASLTETISYNSGDLLMFIFQVSGFDGGTGCVRTAFDFAVGSHRVSGSDSGGKGVTELDSVCTASVGHETIVFPWVATGSALNVSVRPQYRIASGTDVNFSCNGYFCRFHVLRFED